MRTPTRDSEFSRTLDRVAPDRPGPYELELGSIPGGSDAAASEGYETGTTTVGLTTPDGVVLGTDRRASLGGRIVGNKNVMKIEVMQPNAAITFAGSVSAAQAFSQSMRAEANLYEARRGEYMDVEALSTLAANVLRSAPMLVTPILGGVDEEGAHIFNIDPSGSVLPDEYTATGSGMSYAFGLLEEEYHEDVSLEEARSIAVRAIKAAIERDTASGNGVNLATITAEDMEIEHYEDPDEAL